MEPGVKIDVSIVIPARNEEHNIGATLDAVYSQETTFSFEVIVIDSGSSDQTVSIVKNFPLVRLVEIPAEEFGHGKTRNLGAQMAHGDSLVFLNADAVPANNLWLNSLVKPLCDDKENTTAGVFGRHIPKKDCYLYMARDILSSMPDTPMLRSRTHALDFMIFSTVSCAIRKNTWEKYPFDNDIVIAEDQLWAGLVLKEGFKILYQQESMVIHSHNYSPRQLYEIKFDVGRSTGKFKNKFNAFVLGFFLFLGGMAIKILGDFVFILFTYKPVSPFSFSMKLKELSIAFKARAAAFRGKYRGWRWLAQKKKER
jgi:rhamnosyltransferase